MCELLHTSLVVQKCTCVRRRHEPRRPPLARISDLIKSALAHYANSSGTSPEVREVPRTDSCTAANLHLYSITSLARSNSDVGSSIPSVLALLRLTMSSNLTARSIGRPAGGVPFSILSTKVAERE